MMSVRTLLRKVAPAPILRTPEYITAARSLTAPPPAAAKQADTWPCPECQHRTALEELRCAACNRLAPAMKENDPGYCCPECDAVTAQITEAKRAGLPLDHIRIPDHPRGGAR